jgi:Ca2+-transporting ATPase
MLYYNHSAQATLNDLDSSLRGLSNSEAEERLKVHGPNTIRVTGEPLWRKLIEPFANIFMLVLFVAAIISILHGDMLDAIIVIVIMFVSAGIYYVQRFSTERILRSLQKHTAQNVETLRDGHLIQIDTSQLVPGDIISLGEGDKVPADLRFLTGTNVRIDESLLTGESVPIAKRADVLNGEKEIYERSNLLFQGSFVISGDVTAVVTGTGNATEFGQLAALAQDTNTESPVQKKIDKLISHVIAAVGGIAIVAFTLAMRGGMDLGESLRFVMALSVSAVPESLPVAISVVLVLGMRRMATKKALVRTMRAIETIGVLTTIATDKTGTLTKNKLTVQEIWYPEGTDKTFTRILAHAVNQNGRKVHDPLDTAMNDYAASANIELKGIPLLSMPFDQAVAMSGNLWHDGASYRLVVKGAPEHVLARSDLTENEHEQASAKLHHLTGQGYRVIAIAETNLNTKISSFTGLPKRAKLEFIGFVAVADVLRPEAKKAIAAALSAGVTVRMITGDHFETAYHIGRQLGMVTHRDQVFDSRRMSVMSDSELDVIIRDVRVFSRVVPEHKYRILSLLKKHNITAMTGDGVNDVPALSNAHVGVAMGSGAQIAKDAGDIILLDDNFRSIIDAMHEGRTIFANIRRMLFYLLSTNAGEVLTMLGALAIGMPLPIVPVQILWINLVTDTSMVIPLGLEPGEKSNMKNKPKRLNEPILSKFIISRMILVALSMAAITLTLYGIFSTQYDHEYGRTIAFSALVVMQWSNAFNARSDYESLFRRLRTFNGKFYVGLTVAVTLQILAVFGPLQGLLHITPVAIGDLIVTGVIAFVIPLALSELHKFIGRRFFHKGSRR